MKHDKSPRIRTVEKVKPPYKLNRFPKGFALRLGAEIVYLLATKDNPSIKGEEWEQVFAKCINAEWKPSNVGLDDVVLGSCAWGAKTIKGRPERQERVRLISGRNDPIFSFGDRESDPSLLGKQVLTIWNERVFGLREKFKHLRNVVLIKANDLSSLAVFEFETVSYLPERYTWTYNKNNNLVGHDTETGLHRFTWQHHGAQFTIIEEVAADALVIKLKRPRHLVKSDILDTVGFHPSWVEIIKGKG